MSTFDLIVVTASLSGSLCYLLAWRIHGERLPSADEADRYMQRVVSQEELELQEHRLRTIAIRADRLAMPNPESGPPARISRMVVKKGR